jgi:alginate O-acetyltransferase complex protein AlgF
MKSFTRFMIIWMLGLVLSMTLAQEGLYDPAPPANSSFVRVILADASLGSVGAKIGETIYPEITYPSISAYQVVPQGSYASVFGSLETQLEVSAGKFYTVALINGKALLLEDAVNANMTKTLLVFYNLTDTAGLDMKTADGATPVIPGVAAETMQNILVNPIEVSLAAFKGDKKLNSFEGLSLKPGATYSMVIVGSGDAMQVLWASSTVLR